MNTPYHTLLTRDDTNSPWGIAFGDYEKYLVELEAMEYLASDYMNKPELLRIISTATADQKTIDARVKYENDIHGK